ncbi:tyrosine-type recombinase/integrase [Ruegeria arenilitoris]|uniref:tyrosine-type recombinase/integrase n=1 Tax=Ruegeria arenilitoris TaxID=1173585 RepID=UPI00147A85B3|nr:site-specific integrase [Ruegeria arenilitoris]
MATITKLPSGKWRAQVRRKGTYKARTFTRKIDATGWAADIERALEGGRTADTIQPPNDMTLAMVVTAYLQQVETGRTTRFNLERIASRIGGVSLRNLSAVTVQEYVDQRMKDGVGGVTLAGDLSALSSVLKWARYTRKLDVNPDLAKDARAALTTARIDTRSQERDRIPTQDELDRIIAHLEANPRMTIPMPTLIRFAASSGMRLGEICRIRIEDVRWNEKAVLIRERKDPRRKARNDQVVPLVGDAYQIARDAADGHTEGRLFPYNGKSAGAAWQRAVKACGVEDLHFHDLRHLAITELFRLGLPIELVAVVSGHRDWKHLKRYTQLGAADVHSALHKLGASG